MKRIFSKDSIGLGSIIAAVVCACACSLSAQTYTRIHRDELAALIPYWDAIERYRTFAIASPENGAAISSDKIAKPNVGLDSIPVSFSDDYEIMINENGANINFDIDFKKADEDFTVCTVGLTSNDSKLGVINNDNFRFAYDWQDKPFYTNFDVIWDLNNDNIQLRTGMKDKDNYPLSVEFVEGRFRLRPNDYNSLGIYRLDHFNWTIDDSDVKNSGNIVLEITTDSVIYELIDTSIHYILNDGEDVTLDELINSETKIPVTFRKGQTSTVSIPTKEIASRATLDAPTTLWALPINEEFDKIVPLGRIISKKYADDGISTGIVVSTEDTVEDAPVYYTLDGRVAPAPLMPGIYIRRTGSKTDKIIIR